MDCRVSGGQKTSDNLQMMQPLGIAELQQTERE